jgi:hypothetical protein
MQKNKNACGVKVQKISKNDNNMRKGFAMPKN